MKNKLGNFKLYFYGSNLLNTYPTLRQNSPIVMNIPGGFEYNSSWKIEFYCSFCGRANNVYEDFDKNERNFRWLIGLNSTGTSIAFLKEVCNVFDRFKLIEITGVQYINRIDFDYKFEIQRKSSVNLLLHSCPSCKAVFLGDFKVGYPLFPEANKPKGKIGKIRIEGLIGFDQYWIWHKDLIKKLK
jgi:hypothetical protein